MRRAVARGQLVVVAQPLASSRASGRRTRASRSPTPRAGRSGSTASGTACRRAVAARSRRRPGCRTGSGARPRAWPAARGRAGRATTRAIVRRSSPSVTFDRRRRGVTLSQQLRGSSRRLVDRPRRPVPGRCCRRCRSAGRGRRRRRRCRRAWRTAAAAGPAARCRPGRSSCLTCCCELGQRAAWSSRELLGGVVERRPALEVAVERRGEHDEQQRSTSVPSTQRAPGDGAARPPTRTGDARACGRCGRHRAQALASKRGKAAAPA